MEYHRHSIRLKGFDYSQSGYYFVTLCVQNREGFFGEINNGTMKLSDAGRMVEMFWGKLKEKYPHISLDQHVIMPNHMHAIIIVGAGSSRPELNIGININGRGNPAPTLGQIMAYFKYQTTKQLNLLFDQGYVKLWQRNYYEHIIRNEKDYWAIKQYIQDNPRNWIDDELYSIR